MCCCVRVFVKFARICGAARFARKTRLTRARAGEMENMHENRQAEAGEAKEKWISVGASRAAAHFCAREKKREKN